MPKVSILLTSYNHAPFLAEAIDSVLAQTFKDYELIIWDDNSTDDSWQIIQSFTDARIKAYRNPVNRGPVYGVNKTIFEVATGEFFAMHHSDDVWVADKLEKQLACFDQHPEIAAVFTHVQAIAEEGFDLDDEDHLICKVFDQPNRTRHLWLRHFLLHGNALCHPSVLIRRNAYSECGPYSEALWQLPDFDMWVRLLLKHDIYVLPEKLTKFRVLNSEANTSGNRPENRMQWAFEFPQVLNHYRSIQSLEELLKALPEAALFDRGSETMVSYALAQTILNLTEIPTAHLFALTLLYEQLNSPENKIHLQRLYDFGALELARLTRKFDVFNQVEPIKRIQAEREAELLREKIQYYEWLVPKLEQTNLDFSTAIAGLRSSISWRFSTPVRFIGGVLRYPKQFRDRLRTLSETQPSISDGSFLKNVIQLIRKDCGAAFRPPPKTEVIEANPSVGSDMFDRNDYDAWVTRYDTCDETRRNSVASMVDGLSSRPLISILMPTFEANPKWLMEAIDSVRGQIYPNWELCIADDASRSEDARNLLKELEKTDNRIRVAYRDKNGHISEASNSALEMARGEWVALLDHDDLLSQDALAQVAIWIDRYPNAGLIYSDEDKINEQGKRFDPYFKPDWNPDLFLSQNMVSHLGVYRKDLVVAANGFRTGFEGSQDYDLALRITERLEPAQIIHIPRILYHWRAHSNSTALAPGVKNYALQAGVKALQEHFERKCVDAEVEITMGIQYRVRYHLPERLPLVSLVIPTRNALRLVKQCIDSILEKTTYPNFEILLIDNGSDDIAALEYFSVLDNHPRVRVIRDDRPFNYSALNNAAVAQARGEIVGLINNDIEVISVDWLEEMVSIALQPGVGAVGACLWYPNDTMQHGGVVVGLGGVAGHSHKDLKKNSQDEIGKGLYGFCGRAGLVQNYSAVTAACLVVKKERYLQVGGLNEKYLAVAFNDVDFCLKLLEAGYRNVWTPYAELYHHESATRGKEDTPEKQQRAAQEASYMKRRWKKLIAHDPAYNPNLTIHHEDFSLAWPPRL